MDKKQTAKEKILGLIAEKSVIKQQAYDNTLATFTELLNALEVIVDEYNDALGEDMDDRIKLSFRKRSTFTAALKVSGDLIVFSMHSNVFKFDFDNPINKNSYVRDNSFNGYCGIINIYNFLADSFKYQRMDDLGYLIGRIYVNRENHYFVDGKRQLGFLYNDFAVAEVTREALHNIVDSTILYALDFDLLVPPYKNVKFATVGQLEHKMKNNIQTGKRLGFVYSSEDE